MTNREIAAAFDEVADLLEFQGANPFRVRAYRNGARKIGDHPEPLAAVVEDPDQALTDIDGIGKDLAEKVETLLTTGSLPMLEQLRAEIPAGVLALLRIPGLGPKKAAALHSQLNIVSLDMLRAACDADQVSQLKGFGKKTQEMILRGIDLAAHADVRTRWADADAIVADIREHLAGTPGVRQCEAAGSYRRGKETVGDLDFLVDADEPGQVMDRLGAFTGVAEVIARGDTKMFVRLQSGMQVDLRVVPAESFGAALQYFTGSKEHNVELRGRAKARGIRVNEWGVFRVANEGVDADAGPRSGEYLAGRTEAEVYATLGLPCFPPELREARQEYQWAAQGELPQLVELGDLRGDLHAHTNATDGAATLEEMVSAARAHGLDYLAVTDHSKRVTMARGLDAERLLRQWEAIDRLNSTLDGFIVLKGIECDILERGGMDLPDEILAQADWVVASVHYGQNQPAKQITERILQAIENPHVDVIAHPTGRLINRREPYAVDVETMIAAAAKHRKFLELNANPARLDLDDVHAAAAKRRGVPIVISSDAHSIDGFDVLRYGVLQARRAGLSRDDVLNCRPWAEVKQMLVR